MMYYNVGMTSGKRLLAKVAPFAKIVRGVAHPHRLAILYLLAYEPMSPRDIAKHIPVPASVVFHHLKEMHASGWLHKLRVGKHMIYKINKKVIRQIPKFFDNTPLGFHTHKPV